MSTAKTVALALIALLATVGIAAAVSSYISTHPASTTVLPADTITISETVNGAPLAQNAALTFPNVKAGTPTTVTYAVVNSGNLGAVVTVTATGLPAGATFTWKYNGANLNGTVVLAGGNALGDLTLTVPESAVTGQLNFQVTVTATAT